MRPSTRVLLLLLGCGARPACALSAAASWSWPWSWGKPKDPPKSWAPAEANAVDLAERTEPSQAQAAEEAPALQAASGAESAELLQEKQKLEAELEAMQQEIDQIPGAEPFRSRVAGAAEALRLAEERATRAARAAEAGQFRVQELQAELAAKERELEKVDMPQQAQEQAATEAGNETAEQAGNETAAEQGGSEAAEQTTTDPLLDLESQLAAKQRELKLLGAKHKIQALVDAQQSRLDEAVRVQQAKAQAARQAEADRAAQAQQLADAQAAEKAHMEKLQALLSEVSEKQRQLGEVAARAQQAAPTEQAADTLREPTQPGCYMRSPSACPKKPMKTTLWRLDSFAVKQGVGQERCRQRKSMWDRYCGSEDTQMVSVAEQARSE